MGCPGGMTIETNTVYCHKDGNDTFLYPEAVIELFDPKAEDAFAKVAMEFKNRLENGLGSEVKIIEKLKGNKLKRVRRFAIVNKNIKKFDFSDVVNLPLNPDKNDLRYVYGPSGLNEEELKFVLKKLEEVCEKFKKDAASFKLEGTGKEEGKIYAISYNDYMEDPKPLEKITTRYKEEKILAVFEKFQTKQFENNKELTLMIRNPNKSQNFCEIIDNTVTKHFNENCHPNMTNGGGNGDKLISWDIPNSYPEYEKSVRKEFEVLKKDILARKYKQIDPKSVFKE